MAEAHGARIFPSAEALAEEIEVAVVAVPTVAHAELGCALLESGVDVMVEKPIAPSLEEADRLIDAARENGRTLGVGHVEFYNPAVQALLGFLGALAEKGGSVRFVEVQRLAAFTPRSLDVDVVLDLMIHDLQILHALDPSPLAEVRATGIDVLSPAHRHRQRPPGARERLRRQRHRLAGVVREGAQAARLRHVALFLPRLPGPGGQGLPAGGHCRAPLDRADRPRRDPG